MSSLWGPKAAEEKFFKISLDVVARHRIVQVFSHILWLLRWAGGISRVAAAGCGKSNLNASVADVTQVNIGTTWGFAKVDAM